MRGRFVLACVLGGMSTSCSGADGVPMVRARAADDLVCEESSIVVRRELSGSYVASGCGKTHDYEVLCQGTVCTVRRTGSSAPSSGHAGD